MSAAPDPLTWPRWAFVASALLVATLATLMVAVAERPLYVAPVAAVLLVPWIDHVLGKHPPAWMFVSLAHAPLLGLNTVLAEAAGTSTLVVSAILVIVIQGECASAYPLRRLLACVASSAVVLTAHASHAGTVPPVYLVAGTAIAVTVGYLIRRQHETVLELRATQARLVGEAALFERQRIARDVHDVLAHSMTVVMMHVTAARMAVRRDPQEAVEALEEAERLGRSSLAEIRRTVGVLRDDADRATDRALPTGTDVVALVDDYRTAGVTIAFDVRGSLDDVDGTAGLVVYRVVQEGLANAAKHAPGAPVDLTITVGTEVAVRIANPVPAGVTAGPPGHGLVGMAERARGLGGRAEARVEGRFWTVVCHVPLATGTEACRW